MARNTLSWDVCDSCGWRGATSDCMLGGRRVRLCPYCYLVLSSSGILECRHPIVRLHVTVTSNYPVRGLDVNESLIEELTSVSKPGSRTTRRARRSSRTRKTGRKH